MAAINHALLASLFTGFKANFQGGLVTVTPAWERVATRIPSTTKSNTYGWMNQIPRFSEWTGTRTLASIATSGYQITNKDFEATVSVKSTDIEDDEMGIYATLFRDLGQAAAIFPDELVFALLAAGSSTLCHDGQYFFDVDHPVYPNTDGTGTAVATSNVTTGSSPAWYLLDTSKAIKPLIFQERKKPNLVAMTAADDEQKFMGNVYRYGADLRCNVGFGFWQMAYKSQAALNAANFNDAYTKMQSFKADGGRPLAITPTLLVVPPTLRAAALDVVKAERSASGATNTNFNAVDVLVSSYLS